MCIRDRLYIVSALRREAEVYHLLFNQTRAIWRCDGVGADEVPEYIQMMSDDVSSLEALRQRVEAATHGTLDGLDSLNATVNDIEARSASALSTSQQALQVTVA